MASPTRTQIGSNSQTSGTTLTLPAGTPTNGDLLVIGVYSEGGGTKPTPSNSGWTNTWAEAASDATQGYIAVWTIKWETGDPTGASAISVTVANDESAGVSMSINGQDATTPVTAATATGSTSGGSPNPPASGAYASTDVIVLAFGGGDGKNVTLTAPTSYSSAQNVWTNNDGPGANAGICCAERALTASTSEDPGAFGSSTGGEWGAATVVVQTTAGATTVEPPAATVTAVASAAVAQDEYEKDTLADTDLYAYWRLGESGTTAVDIEGGFDVTFDTGVTKGQTALIKNAADDAVDMDGTSGLGDTGSGMNPWSSAFTLEVWATTDTADTVSYFGLGAAGTYEQDGFRFGRLASPDGWGFWTDQNVDGVGSGFSLASNVFPTQNVVYHVVATWDGSSTFKIYVDGALKGTNTGGTYDVPATGGMTLGGLRYGGDWNGKLDEWAVYSAEKSAAWVADRYELGWRTKRADAATATASALEPTIVTGGTTANAVLAPATATGQVPEVKVGTEPPNAAVTATAEQVDVVVGKKVTPDAATATASVPQAEAKVAPEASVAAATAAAPQPETAIAPEASVATATASALQPEGLGAAEASVAAVTASALQPEVRIAPEAQIATATATAEQADAAVGKRVTPDVATATAAAPQAEAKVAPEASVAATTASALQAEAKVAPEASVAAATASALQPESLGAAEAQAATATAAGQQAEAKVAPEAQAATVTATAEQVTVTTATSTTATPDAATVTASTLAATASVAPEASVATVTASVLQPEGLGAPEAQAATATAAALQAEAKVAPEASVASTTATAEQPTVSTAASVTATPDAATATAAAPQAEPKVAPEASVAAATASALQPEGLGAPEPAAAAVTASALQAEAKVAPEASVAATTARAWGGVTSIEALPDAATATVAGPDSQIAVTAHASVATATATAYAPTVNIGAAQPSGGYGFRKRRILEQQKQLKPVVIAQANAAAAGASAQSARVWADDSERLLLDLLGVLPYGID